MTSRSLHGDQEAPAAEGLGDHDLAPRAIQHYIGADALSPGRSAVKVAHAAKIAFSFFPYIAGKEQVTGQLDARAFECGGHGEQAGDLGTLVRLCSWRSANCAEHPGLASLDA